jgi:hypothetical protein
MGKKKKQKPLPPRAKRMRRSSRLKAARVWLPEYQGKNIAAGYRKHFGVDWACAFKELKMLGVQLNPDYVAAVLRSVAHAIEIRKRRKVERKQMREAQEADVDQDENFAYIVGYTPAGFAYGVTWEEHEKINQAEIDEQDDSIPF